MGLGEADKTSWVKMRDSVAYKHVACKNIRSCFSVCFVFEVLAEDFLILKQIQMLFKVEQNK